jgi:hypothetical protein
MPKKPPATSPSRGWSRSSSSSETFSFSEGSAAFGEDCPKAKAFFVYTGSRRRHEGGIEIMPAADALHSLDALIG